MVGLADRERCFKIAFMCLDTQVSSLEVNEMALRFIEMRRQAGNKDAKFRLIGHRWHGHRPILSAKPTLECIHDWISYS